MPIVRPVALMLAAVAVLGSAALVATVGVDWWSWMIGTVTGACIATVVRLRTDSRGAGATADSDADGERSTGKVLKPLVAQGWKVKHDVDLGRGHGNADHILLSPTGVAYLLETKTLAGKVTIDAGVIICRFPDDPEEIRRFNTARQLTRLAERVSHQWQLLWGRTPPTIHPVVVIWGLFPQILVRDEGIMYVAGDALADALLRDASAVAQAA